VERVNVLAKSTVHFFFVVVKGAAADATDVPQL
jgi:hypothetical protein